MFLTDFWRNKTERYGAINTHDVIKFIALVIMTIDHIGAYCFPDQLWWRVVGRSTFSVWFFLVGYSRGQTIPPVLIALACMLVAVQPFVQLPIFPLNALVSIILCRLVVRYVEQKGWLERYPGELGSVCFMLWLPTMYLFEYGSIAVAFALWGAMIRRHGSTRSTQKFAVFCVVLFCATQMIAADYSLVQCAAIALGTGMSCWYLQHFTIRPIWVAQHGTPWAIAIRFISRQSLYYYAIHRVILQALGAYLFMTGKVQSFTWVLLT